MGQRKLFGTDGIRGKANVYPMTGDVAFNLGRAVTHYFVTQKRNKKPLIILGKDTRLSCYMLEQAFSAGVCSQGGQVILTGPLPTPGVAFVTRSMRADVGVMISASHNAYFDNGIKIFDSKGFKLPDEVELILEDYILNPEKLPVQTNGHLGNAKRLKEVFGRYLVQTKAALGADFDLEGLRIVLDCANGAAYKVAPMMFRELGAEIFPIGVEPNGTNINMECGSLHPGRAQEMVKTYRADLGICLDGDADRLIVCDSDGNLIDGDCVIGLFAKLLLDRGELSKGDTIVGTIMSNLGLENYIRSLGLSFHRTKVGDRYIMEYMREHSSILGGEPSGHVILANHSTTGDGCLAALKLIECLKFYNRSLAELTSDIQLYPQKLINVPVKEKRPLKEVKLIQDELTRLEKTLDGKGRIVLRYSGTESLIRVMVEAKSDQLVEEIIGPFVKLVKKALS